MRKMIWLPILLILAGLCGCDQQEKDTKGSQAVADSTGSKGTDVALKPADKLLTILSPPDKAILSGRTLELFAVSNDNQANPKLEVDGKPFKAERYLVTDDWTMVFKSGDHSVPVVSKVKPGQLILASTILLEPGEHAIKVGNEEISVLARDEQNKGDIPSGWKEFHMHPPVEIPGQTTPCSTCHEIKEGSVLAKPNTPKACLGCHDEKEYERVHMHKLESLAACQLCHQAHGSTTKKWLKDANEVLCAVCHE